MALFVKPIGELEVKSTIVLPVQPTCAITVSLVRTPDNKVNSKEFCNV